MREALPTTRLPVAEMGPAQQVAFLSSVLESSTEYSIIAKDLGGQVLAWNDGAKRNYGYTAEEMVGRQTSNILHVPEDIESGRVATFLETALRTGKAEVPAIVVSIVADSESAHGLSVQAVLTKPVDASDVIGALDRAGVRADTGGSILIVDDDPGLAKLAGNALDAVGCRWSVVGDAEAALRSIAEHPPSAVVLDLALPGMDGLEFLQRFRRTTLGRYTPVIVWTVRDLTTLEMETLGDLGQ